MKEAVIRRLFRRKCKEWGYMQIPLTGVVLSGIPDVYIVDLKLFVEFKSDEQSAKTSRIQKIVHQQIEQHGGEVITIRDHVEMDCLCPSNQPKLFPHSLVRYPRDVLKTNHPSFPLKKYGLVK